jgi:hypothetical protein
MLRGICLVRLTSCATLQDQNVVTVSCVTLHIYTEQDEAR